MKIISIITCITSALLFLSCKKDKAPIISSTNNSIPTTVGSYWIYDCNNRDVNGNITAMGVTDTVRIIGDTLIGGHTFITYEGTHYGTGPFRWYHRDSSGYIIDNNSKIQYTTVNFNDTLLSYIESGTYQFDWVMKPFAGSQTAVPAGSFNTTDYQGHCRKVDGQPFSGCGNDVYIVHNYYYPNIGLIKASTIFYGQLEASCNDMEKVLQSYHIE